ncbi:MAG: hypothetical protein ACJ79S_13610 [Gemmatimonadaceae bacterium]
MSRSLLPVLSALVLATVAAACSADRGTGPGGGSAFAFDDAVADTLAASEPTTVRAIDATRVAGRVTDDTIEIVLTFREPVATWTDSVANSLDGFVDIDVDENRATGIPADIDEEGLGSAEMGSDYYVSLRDDGAGHVALVDPATGSANSIPATFSGSTVTIRVPLALVGRDDGNFTMAAVIGNGDRPTDLLPNGGHYTVHR